MQRTLTYRLLAVGCLLVVVFNTWVAGRALGSLFNAETWLSHTLEVITQTEATQDALSRANNDLRSFLLTGDSSYRTEYHAAQSATIADVNHLQYLTRDSSSQQERVRILRSRLAVRYGAMDAALSMNPRSTGMALDDRILLPALSESPDGGITPRYTIAQLEGEERRLLADRTNAATRGRRSVVLSFAGASLLDVVLLLIAFELLIRAQRSRAQLAERASEIENLNSDLTTANASLEVRVAERTRELQVSNQELEAFSYSVSHDLRAPLRTIDGFSLALKEDYSHCLNEEGQDYIARVRGGVQRMGGLIDALLQLSRVTRSDIQRERFDLSQLATNVFTELSAAEPERTVEWTAQPDLWVHADPRLIRVALENLVGNAWKFTSRTESPRIEFGRAQRDGKTVYFIRDNGAGFDMQYVDRLFTAFQRLHGDREFKGSGIGLATVSRIIRRHHGTIGAEGGIGQGAMFYFTLGD